MRVNELDQGNAMTDSAVKYLRYVAVVALLSLPVFGQTAGTYTASASLNAADSTRAMFSLQLIGLRPAVTGLGCNGVPVASGSIAQWTVFY